MRAAPRPLASGDGPRARILAPPPLLAAVCLGMGIAVHHWQPLPLFPDSLSLRLALALPLFALSAALGTWGLATFRRQRTTFHPYGTPTSLVTDGPFRFSRNPLYVALLLAVLAFAPALDDAWVVAAAILLLALLDLGVVRPEERLLRGLFGEPYDAYRRRVRRWL